MGSCLAELLLRIQFAAQTHMDLEEHLGMLGDREIRELPEDGHDLVDLRVPCRGPGAVRHPSSFLPRVACHFCALTHRT
ncbi:hypothetical protein [Arthrobacter agilis]|uniref:hypothetical protein n=1 Tax=Arthrobacter agilis TaxID=37921 RepID=UPI001ABF2155|nr:hypothetical protein [Arthrobacter agilis]